MKEPKEKHVIFILECLKGKHLELVRPKDALTKLFDRFFTNLRSVSLMFKALIILHRALQEEDISQMVAHKIKEKENLLYPCQNDEQSYDIKMQCFICDFYISYIKNLINFIIICQLFSISLKDLHNYSKSLKHQELFLIFSRIDTLIEDILKVFEQKAYCQSYRLLHSVIYLLFVDLLKIYQSYYLLVTVMLEKFTEMDLKDAKRAFLIYLNFIKVNKEIRKMATSVISEFNIKLKFHFYDVDTKVIEGLKLAIEAKEREKSQRRVSTDLTQNGESPPNFQRDYRAAEKIEFMTESKKLKKRPQMTIEFPQGGQGMQRLLTFAGNDKDLEDKISDLKRIRTEEFNPFMANVDNRVQRSQTIGADYLGQIKFDKIQKAQQQLEEKFKQNEIYLQRFQNIEQQFNECNMDDLVLSRQASNEIQNNEKIRQNQNRISKQNQLVTSKKFKSSVVKAHQPILEHIQEEEKVTFNGDTKARRLSSKKLSSNKQISNFDDDQDDDLFKSVMLEDYQIYQNEGQWKDESFFEEDVQIKQIKEQQLIRKQSNIPWRDSQNFKARSNEDVNNELEDSFQSCQDDQFNF